MTADLVGMGTPAAEAGRVSGPLLRLQNVDEVLALLEDDDGRHVGAIAVVPDAGATFLAPIFGELAGLLCLNGTPGSHLAIVSRDFGTPALFSFSFTGQPPADGETVALDTVAGVVTIDRAEPPVIKA